MRQRESHANNDNTQAFPNLDDEVTSENGWQLRETDPQGNPSPRSTGSYEYIPHWNQDIVHGGSTWRNLEGSTQINPNPNPSASGKGKGKGLKGGKGTGKGSYVDTPRTPSAPPCNPDFVGKWPEPDLNIPPRKFGNISHKSFGHATRVQTDPVWIFRGKQLTARQYIQQASQCPPVWDGSQSSWMSWVKERHAWMHSLKLAAEDDHLPWH